jgi:tetratricopeptide (TPR) repeat protein
LNRAGSRRRRRLLWTFSLLGLAAVAGAAAGIAVFRATRPEGYRPGGEVAGITRSLERDLPEGAPHPAFTDVTTGAGLAGFRAFAGGRGSQLPEDMGAGASWGDYDGDGDDDLFLVSAGGALGLPEAERAPSELYENLGDGTFRRSESFPDLRVTGMGAAWGDADGDGRLDLVVTGYRVLRLFRNDGRRFLRDPRLPEPDGFWAGASWGDYDRDGDLDLYVCGYVRYREERRDAGRSLQYGREVPYTLNPSSYEPERNLLFRNDGGGFVEVAEQLGVANPEGRSLTAVWHDLDGDGWLDLYVANDISDNVLYRNTGGGFEDRSHAAWVADYRGAMGLAVGDWNADGDDDLFITHWVAQENALYDSLVADLAGKAGDEPLRFLDVADQVGLGQIALSRVGWGAEFADLDADGWLDLLVANGSTFETGDDPPRLEPQPMFLFWNHEGKAFHDLAPLQPDLGEPRVGRGLAVSDYDGDGDPDFVIVDLAGGVKLFRNDLQGGRWIELRLAGGPGGRGDGARLVARAGGRTMRRSLTFGSYLSQSSRTVHLGLGEADRVDSLEVHWAGGTTDAHADLAAGAVWELVEGSPAPRRVGPALGAAAPEGDRRRLAAFWETQRAAVRAMKTEGDPARAIELFRQALAFDPRHEDSLYYLGQCLEEMGDVAGAIAALEELTAVNPQSHRAHRQLGVFRAVHARSDADLEAAAADLGRALATNQEETGALLVLGEIDLLRGRDDAAEERLALACRTNPRAVGGFFLRAYLAWKRGDAAQARALLARAREALGPDWKPEQGAAEGDVRRRMHRDATPLAAAWQGWDGELEPLEAAFAPLQARLAAGPGG